MKIKISHTQHKIDIANKVFLHIYCLEVLGEIHVSTCNHYGIMRIHDMPLNNYTTHNITLMVCLTCGAWFNGSEALVAYDNTWNYRVES
jgi:hypothetical protein